MDKNLNDLLIIDQKIGDFYYENNTLTNDEFIKKFDTTDYVSKALKLINKLSGRKVLELLKRSNYLIDFIDLKKFLKPYKINKKYLKENNDMYIVEYKKLRNICFMISDIATSNYDYEEYMNVLNIDNISDYLLHNMPNNQIYALSCETGLWEEKLFYFSFLKK